MPDSFELSDVIPARPEQIYQAWLSSEGHTAMTGEKAQVTPGVGGDFRIGEYMWGKHQELEPNRRIVQTWRTVQFPEGSQDSRLEVYLDEADGGTRVRIVHSNVPDGQGGMYR
ncbi:MAG TPA: SRPBCC domain-containing protein, partial [Myxococcaceae bacterium]|nr:SRPBCC domain-containing protein [Myxococcaceae bacterium]